MIPVKLIFFFYSGGYLEVFVTELGKRCRVTVLLDFCYSEGVLGDIPAVDNVDPLTGLVVFSASRRAEKSYDFEGTDGRFYGCLVHFITKYLDEHGPLPNKHIISMLTTQVDIHNEMKKEKLKTLGPEADPMVVEILKSSQHPKMKFNNWVIISYLFLMRRKIDFVN